MTSKFKIATDRDILHGTLFSWDRAVREHKY